MLDEDRIISLIIAKDQNAFKQLIDEYKDYVYSVILSIVKDVHQAEEATQDTFMKIFKRMAGFNKDSKLSTWMYRIAYRTGLDYLKKRKHHLSDVTKHQHISSSTDLERDLHQQSLLEFVKEFITNLPSEESTIMTLFYLNQRSIKEVQSATGLTETNIKTKLFRSRNSLRLKAKDFFNQENDLFL